MAAINQPSIDVMAWNVTLREYAAIQIFAQMLPERGWESNPKTAVEMADALLDELAKREETPHANPS